MMKIFRALTFGSLSDASDTDCAKADDMTAVSANRPRPSTRPPKQRACASLLGIKRAIIGWEGLTCLLIHACRSGELHCARSKQ